MQRFQIEKVVTSANFSDLIGFEFFETVITTVSCDPTQFNIFNFGATG